MAIHRVNAPPARRSSVRLKARRQAAVRTSAFVKEALDKGTALFKWENARRGAASEGFEGRGVGVATSTYVAGSAGFDGLFVIRPDGRLSIQSGIGNLGTESFSDCIACRPRSSACRGKRSVVTWGDTAKNLPWTCISGGSQTIHAMTRAAHAAGHGREEEAAGDRGQGPRRRPDDYKVANERVYQGRRRSMTLAKAAQRAIELGGEYDGHEVPENINTFTKRRPRRSPGRGSWASRRTNTRATAATLLRRRVRRGRGRHRDRQVQILDYLAVAESARHSSARPRRADPRPLDARHRPRHRPEVGLRPAYGVPLAQRYHHKSPDDPRRAQQMAWAALNIPDPETPVGAHGIGEPPVGAGGCAVLNAISDALGDESSSAPRSGST